MEVDAVLSDDPNTPEPTDPTEVQVISAADLSGLTKSVRDLNGAPVRPGDRLEYSLVVSNQGDAVGTNVVLIDAAATMTRRERTDVGREIKSFIVVLWAWSLLLIITTQQILTMLTSRVDWTKFKK